MAAEQPDDRPRVGPIPTTEGDVVVRHLGSLYDVWLVETDGAQEPDEVTRTTCWTAEEAERIVQAFAEAGGRIFVLRADGLWYERNNFHRVDV